MTRNSCTLYGAVLALFGALAASPEPLYAAESTPHQNHVMDSSNNRTPAITVFPTYPRIARRDRIEGEAVVCFKIALYGEIRSVRVKSYSNRIFRRPALRAIKESSFEPLRPHEIFSTARTCRTYRFRLEPIEANESE